MSDQPYIPKEKILPEFTLKGVLLGMILSMILAAANIYLGLFSGMTVSASIPAAVISMAVLRFFKNSNILENNAVQTAASAGESLAAGVIFTFPALVLMGYWKDFNYWETTLIAIVGGLLGVLFTIPLRKALIVRQKLKFPEGVATAEVLKAGESGGSSIKFLAFSALAGAFFKFGEAGAKLWHGVLDLATLKGKTFLYFGMNLSPALVSVGYIVGLNVATVVFVGGCVSWYVAIPAYIMFNDVDTSMDAVNLGYSVWNSQIRYLGVGAMVVGGLWALINLKDAFVMAIQESVAAFKKSAADHADTDRTEKDISMKWVLFGIAVTLIPVFLIYHAELQNYSISVFMVLVMLVTGFLFTAVAGYMCGLVGSSNNPISGSTIATILLASFALLFLLGDNASAGAASAILIGAVVCCAAAIAGDNMQDLKSGHILGATPYKQQWMQFLGVIASAFVMAPVLTLLNTAYGFGPKTAEQPNALAAPQATLMQGVAEGVFGKGLPWDMIGYGAVLAVLAIIIDEVLKKKGSEFRVPVLAFAIGIYLPFELDSAMMVGGILSYVVTKWASRPKFNLENAQKSGLLFASGLITGEALMGIGIAIPIALSGNGNVMALVDSPLGVWPGVLLLAGICAWLLNSVKKAGQSA